MLLRSTFEKHLPIKDGEERLSDDARKMVFRGMYWFPGSRIVDVVAKRNYDRRTEVHYPHKLEIVREAGGVRSYSTGDVVYKEPTTLIQREMMGFEKLARANRVERVARRVKGVINLALVSAGVGGMVLLGVNHDADQAKPDQGIEQCDKVIDGTETLVPVETQRAEQLQKAGELVCSIADHDYLANPAN